MHGDDPHADAVVRTLSSALAELDAGRPLGDVLPAVLAALRAALGEGSAVTVLLRRPPRPRGRTVSR